MPNRLQHEKSLYLRQHADNPVDWYPWGEEAFAKAKAEDKPVLVSIGYSSCHWCHVMAHESFENNFIAKLMNTHFVCVKVDREERPDVDQIYMEAVQMLNGHGGWPLNVFCLPDGRPFAGGTYFPPDEKRGHSIVPWPQLLMRVSDFYARQRDDLEENARAIVGNLETTNSPHKATGDPVTKGDLLVGLERVLENADKEFGGFGGAPKFPPSMTLDFLLSMRASATVEERYPEMARDIDTVVNRTLTAMAHGGLFDQFGGGFARYSVDAHWIIPHFEKMLYDNALLIDIYSKAWQRYPKPLYQRVVEETIGWLEREMRAPSGACSAALDADTEGEEGKTYLWDPEEVRQILDPETARQVCTVYGIDKEGNFENSGLTNPTLLEGDIAVRDALAPAREKLLAARNQRPQPGRDDKLLTAWNALLMRALARAGFVFDRPEWVRWANEIGEWIWKTMRTDGDRLRRVAYGDEVRVNGQLDDYAYAIEGYLSLASVIDWVEPGRSGPCRERAEALAAVARQHFRDANAVGYYYTSDDHEALVHRKKEWFDNATPSGNSSLLRAFTELSLLTGSADYAEEVERLKVAYPGIVQTAPAAASHAMAGLVYEAIGLATVKVQSAEAIEPLRAALVGRPYRPVHIQLDDSGELSAAYQLCIGTQCLAPTNAVESLVSSL